MKPQSLGFYICFKLSTRLFLRDIWNLVILDFWRLFKFSWKNHELFQKNFRVFQLWVFKNFRAFQPWTLLRIFFSEAGLISAKVFFNFRASHLPWFFKEILGNPSVGFFDLQIVLFMVSWKVLAMIFLRISKTLKSQIF